MTAHVDRCFRSLTVRLTRETERTFLGCSSDQQSPSRASDDSAEVSHTITLLRGAEAASARPLVLLTVRRTNSHPAAIALQSRTRTSQQARHTEDRNRCLDDITGTQAKLVGNSVSESSSIRPPPSHPLSCGLAALRFIRRSWLNRVTSME
jgi:hypothetical protein